MSKPQGWMLVAEQVIDTMLAGAVSANIPWCVEDALEYLGKQSYSPSTVKRIKTVVDRELVICWNCHHWERRDNLCEDDLCEVCYGDRY